MFLKLLQQMPVVSLAILLLAGCNAATPQPISLPPTATSAPPPTATPTAPVPAPTRIGLDGLRMLLEYIPAEWADYHPDEVLGPQMHWLDVARMRQDLALPPITGTDTRKAKLPLITGLNTEGLMLPSLYLTGDAFDKWGWDIADVDQVLYSSLNESCIVLGNFGRPEIQERLKEKGYTERTLEGFRVFTGGSDPLNFALKPDDTLIISSSEAAIKDLIQQKAEPSRGMDQHSSVAALLKHLENAWGAFLAPSGDWTAFSAEMRANLDLWPPDMREKLAEIYKPDQESQAGWDFVAIGFWGSKQSTTTLRFLYYYPSEQEASKDIALVKTALTEVPSLRASGRLWGDLVTLQSVEVQDTVLKATTETNSKSLIGDSIAQHDFGFLPVRTMPVTKTADINQSQSPASAITKSLTTTLPSGWIRYENLAEGFAVALPPAWHQIDMDPKTAADILQSYTELDPRMTAALSEQAKAYAASAVKFWGLDLSPKSIASGYIANAYITTARLQAEMPLSALVQASVKNMEKLDYIIEPISHQRVDLAIGEAEKLSYELDIVGPQEQHMTVAVTQYLIIKGKNLYNMTLATKADQADDYDAIFEGIGQSFELIK